MKNSTTHEHPKQFVRYAHGYRWTCDWCGKYIDTHEECDGTYKLEADNPVCAKIAHTEIKQ